MKRHKFVSREERYKAVGVDQLKVMEVRIVTVEVRVERRGGGEVFGG